MLWGFREAGVVGSVVSMLWLLYDATYNGSALVGLGLVVSTVRSAVTLDRFVFDGLCDGDDVLPAGAIMRCRVGMLSMLGVNGVQVPQFLFGGARSVGDW